MKLPKFKLIKIILMDNSFLHSYANLSNIKLPLKKNISINNLSISKKNIFPKLFLHKRKSNNKISKKYLHDRKSFEKSIFQSTFITKNQISNSNNYSKTNMRTSSMNENKNNHLRLIESSNNFLKKKSNYFKNNENNFSQKKKFEEKWKIQNKLSKILNKSKSIQPKYKRFLETENNQKVIFNKLDIGNNRNHLIKGKNIIIENDEYNSKKEIEKLKDKVNYLIKKNNILENEKNENNQRIDILEKKIDKLINYIKINLLFI